MKKIKNLENLTEKEAYQLQEKIILGKLKTQKIIDIFDFFDQKGMTDQELIGILQATRSHMRKIKPEFECLDTCGTGGDKLNTFNISSVSAVVCASLGIPVAKHGNRSASSKCGSADVFEALGVKIDLEPKQALNCLKRSGIVFMFAPLFHPALIHVKEARQKYAKPNYFNILGPMLNPAGAKYQLIGSCFKDKIELMGKTLIKTGSKKVVLVNSEEGMDEISIASRTEIFEFFKTKDGAKSKVYQIKPVDFNLKSFSINDIKGGEAQENARIFKDVLQNKASQAKKNAVMLNAGAAIYTFGKAKTIQDGVKMAQENLENGKVYQKLLNFIKISNQG
jgi:anthranilate phosphoribosyltransferase